MKNVLIIFLLSSNLALSQSTLNVECYQNSAFNFQNNISLDANLVEYALCSYIPSFYVAIFDTNCTAWHTIYQGGSGYFLGNYNTEWLGACKARSENYFIFQQNDQQQLESLDSLINYWIPNDHAFVIYTPISFDFSAVNSIQPSLGQTLINNWGNEVVNAQMMVLFGVKGYINSYDIDTTITNGFIDYTNIICPNYEQSLGFNNNEISNQILLYPNPSNGSFEVNSEIKIFSISILDLKGVLISYSIVNDYQVDIKTNVTNGIYIIKIELANGEVETHKISIQ